MANYMLLLIKKSIYLREIPISEDKSPDFDIIEPIKPIKRSIPNMNHPWRKKSFDAFVLKQQHRIELQLEKEAY